MTAAGADGTAHAPGRQHPVPTARSRRGRARRRAGAVLIVTLVAVSPPTSVRAQDVPAELPPARVTKGPALPAALVASIRHKVRDAVAKTRRHVPAVVDGDTTTAAKGSASRSRRRLACEVRDVDIALESSDLPGSPVAATVTGRVRSYLEGTFPSDSAARAGGGAASPGEPTTAAVFALLYVHAAGQPDDEWRLTLAKSHPTPRAASKKDAAQPVAEPAWRDLWSGESGGARQPACMAAAIWGHPGVR
jgi:hypothetical protein